MDTQEAGISEAPVQVETRPKTPEASPDIHYTPIPKVYLDALTEIIPPISEHSVPRREDRADYLAGVRARSHTLEYQTPNPPVLTNPSSQLARDIYDAKLTSFSAINEIDHAKETAFKLGLDQRRAEAQPTPPAESKPYVAPGNSESPKAQLEKLIHELNSAGKDASRAQALLAQEAAGTTISQAMVDNIRAITESGYEPLKLRQESQTPNPSAETSTPTLKPTEKAPEAKPAQTSRFGGLRSLFSGFGFGKKKSYEA